MYSVHFWSHSFNAKKKVRQNVQSKLFIKAFWLSSYCQTRVNQVLTKVTVLEGTVTQWTLMAKKRLFNVKYAFSFMIDSLYKLEWVLEAYYLELIFTSSVHIFRPYYITNKTLKQ